MLCVGFIFVYCCTNSDLLIRIFADHIFDHRHTWSARKQWIQDRRRRFTAERKRQKKFFRSGKGITHNLRFSAVSDKLKLLSEEQIQAVLNLINVMKK